MLRSGVTIARLWTISTKRSRLRDRLGTSRPRPTPNYAKVTQKPGPKGPRKATGQLRERILELRAAQHSVTEIAQALTAAGTPISAQSVWRILDTEGLPRLPHRDDTHRGSPTRLDTIQAGPLPHWPEEDTTLPCDHAGLLLLIPGMVDLSLHQLIGSCGYPATNTLTAWHSIGTLLLAKCARRPRTHHIDALTDDLGLAFTLALTALPKATHLGSYSYRVHRDSNQRLMSEFITALRPFGLATGATGFNLDVHAIRHHGQDAILDELTDRGITWLTLRMRGKAELARLAALPASDWRTVRVERPGRYRHPRLHEDLITLTGIQAKVRQIAVTNIGRDQPTLLITNALATPAKELFARYAERMVIENELDAYISGFHLDALSSGLPLNVDLEIPIPWWDNRKLRFTFPPR